MAKLMRNPIYHPLSSFRGLWFQFYCVLHRNSSKKDGGDRDHVPHFAESALGPHCLHFCPFTNCVLCDEKAKRVLYCNLMCTNGMNEETFVKNSLVWILEILQK